MTAMKPSKIVALVVLGLALIPLASIVWELRHLLQIPALAETNPATTALIEQRRAEAVTEGRPFRPVAAFVPFETIAPHLRDAVQIAEDASFFTHRGVDVKAMKEAMRRDLERGAMTHGGSTITQQLAKNLFLSSERSFTRKIAEVVLAKGLELFLSKERIFELYLNYIEWGDGIFGCEAAAQVYFSTACSRLGLGQSIRLAAIIVNPRRFSPFNDDDFMVRRRAFVAEHLYSEGFISRDEFDALPFSAAAP
jgi:monofunctional glycosyltransferase